MMVLHGLPIGWRDKKLQERIGLWRPVKSETPPHNEVLLFAKEWSDCGWLIDTGQMHEGKCIGYRGANRWEEFSPDYWMLTSELTEQLEAANYPKHQSQKSWWQKITNEKP